MGKNLIAWGVLCLVPLFFCACDCASPKSNEDSPEETVKEALDFNLDGERRGRFFRKRISRTCNMISEISNKAERVALLGKLAESFSKLKLSDYSPREKESMADVFCLSLEYVSYQLVQNDFDEKLIGDFILKGFHEFQDMCFSCGNPADYSSDHGADVRERYRLARALHGSWKNAVTFWEQTSIRTIFHGRPDAAKRFRERWLYEFGSPDGKRDALSRKNADK